MFKITSTEGSPFRVLVDGVEVSQHNTDHKAIESGVNQRLNNSDAEITIHRIIEYRIGSLPIQATEPETPPEEEEDPTVKDPIDEPGSELPSSEFVQVQNGEFTVEGNIFRFNGTNGYYLPNYEAAMEPAMVTRAFDAFQEANVKVVRMWGFYDGQPQWSNDTPIQPNAREYNEVGLAGLDRVIAKGKEKGIRFIIPFVNYWTELGGFHAYCDWAGIPKDFNSFIHSEEAQGIFRDYISMILNRVNTVTGVAYKDEPAIMAWEVCNEATNPGHDPQIMRDWYQNIIQFIKSIDSNHLVATGEDGYEHDLAGSSSPYSVSEYSNTFILRAKRGTSYTMNLGIPEVDFGGFHWYPTGWGWSSFGDEMLRAQDAWVRDHQRLAQDVGKPAICGEYGFPGWGDERVDAMYRALYQTIEDCGLAGSLLWQLVADHIKCWEYGGNICYPAGRADEGLFSLFKEHSTRHNT